MAGDDERRDLVAHLSFALHFADFIRGLLRSEGIAFFAAGGSVTRALAPDAVKAGCLVIDKSSHYRTDPEVPLVIPEINPEKLRTHRGIIANPNCSTIQMVVALKPIHAAAKIKRVVVSTYQSTSGAGKEAMDELWQQTKSKYVPGQEVPPKKFTKQIAFNVIPHIDVFLDDGSTKEEWKMVAETKKILDPKVKVTATCVRVPVFVGHSEALNIEFEKETPAANLFLAMLDRMDAPTARLERHACMQVFLAA